MALAGVRKALLAMLFARVINDGNLVGGSRPSLPGEPIKLIQGITSLKLALNIIEGHRNRRTDSCTGALRGADFPLGSFRSRSIGRGTSPPKVLRSTGSGLVAPGR